MEATHGVTNQLALLRAIDRANINREAVCLVTFNYDRLLEAALRSLGQAHRIESMQDYTAGARIFRLFKLHGSTNWGLEYDNSPKFALNAADKAEAARLVTEQIWKLRNPEDYAFSDARTLLSKNNRPLFPAIAIPVEDKNEFQCPAQAQDALEQLLPSVTRVITIGWRASEAHFLRLTAKHLRSGVGIYVVAGSPKEAEEIRTRIVGAMPGSPPSSRAENVHGFTEFMLSGSASTLLSG